MGIQRILHDFTAGTGTSAKADTGPPINGAIHAVRWESMGSTDTGATDTGADIAIFVQQREPDTGDGLLVLNDNDILGADRVWYPRKNMTLDTGDSTNITNLEPVVAAGERCRVRITAGSAGVKGRLYMWVKDVD